MVGLIDFLYDCFFITARVVAKNTDAIFFLLFLRIYYFDFTSDAQEYVLIDMNNNIYPCLYYQMVTVKAS